MMNMDPVNWIAVKRLLDEVLLLEPSRRRSFLESAAESPEIISEVESLLKADGQSADFMTVDVEELTKDLLAEDQTESAMIGQRFGIYEIRRELGIGGMGAVFLAERADGEFDRKVAIKMLKRELNVSTLRRNFSREREILARLEHPNIARLLDAGKTDDGVPFLVMEYVEGVPIDQFCKTAGLSLAARLKLFNKVCDAVSFAHRNLIVHRDLKPSNILVTQLGEPKLLDFGISKLLDADENAPVTILGAMTPDYASPEQIKGEPVSTASDVYSLGVVLFKMLTNSLPIRLTGKTNGELIRTATEDDPAIPSSAVDRSADGDATMSADFIARSLKGDLDNIVLKALSKEPERRYQTIEQFSADIWRHLDGMPILARPATRSYRAGKFIKRHKIPVVALVLIFLSLMGGTAVAMWQARRAEAHALDSAIETEKAREEQRKSAKVTKFVSKIFGYANPGWFAEGAKTQGKARVIDVVEELSSKIDDEFPNEPDVAAELHSTFAGIFHWVSKSAPPDIRDSYQQKRRFHALRGLELRKIAYGEYHELIATDMFGTYGMIGSTDMERAEYLMRAILMLRDLNPRNINYAFMYEAYVANLIIPEREAGHELWRRAVAPATDENKYQIAERMLREALEVWKIHYPPDHGVHLTKNCWLAYALAKQEKWQEFDAPFQICRQIELLAPTDESVKPLMPDFELVDRALRDSGRVTVK